MKDEKKITGNAKMAEPKVSEKRRKTVKSGILEILEQNRGAFLSGEALAETLGCTRAAVWKGVTALREEGYAIEAVPNRGYRLSPDDSRLSAEGLRLYLKAPQAMIRVCEQVESTNQAAKLAALQGEAGHGAIVAAMEQTGGRGRRGRGFFSPKDAGLYFSVVLQPTRSLRESLLITTAAAVSVYKAVLRVCGISLGIKWLNDLYRDGKKVCGILTEAVTDFESGDIEFAIVGIGLNLYKSADMPAELQEVAGALYDTREEAQKMDRNRLVAEIVNTLLEEIGDLKLSPDYMNHNLVPGREILLTEGGSTRRVHALSICSDGRLLVQEPDGTEKRLSYGEVSIHVLT